MSGRYPGPWACQGALGRRLDHRAVQEGIRKRDPQFDGVGPTLHQGFQQRQRFSFRGEPCAQIRHQKLAPRGHAFLESLAKSHGITLKGSASSERKTLAKGRRENGGTQRREKRTEMRHHRLFLCEPRSVPRLFSASVFFSVHPTFLVRSRYSSRSLSPRPERHTTM
jgi:hypothetical protein